MSDGAIPADLPRPGTLPDWSFAALLGFRIAFIYWAVFCVEAGLANLFFWATPWAATPIAWLVDSLQEGAVRVGAHLFHLSGVAATLHPSGSGDTAAQYVLCFCLLLLAVIGGGIWTSLSEWRGGRREYRTWYAWLRLALRFTLGMILLSYGFQKIFSLQFRSPSLLVLTGTYGDSSPMRLLWTFMGASPAYSAFGGLAEAGAGFLLLFRRTSTLGALLSSGVLLNVVLLNFCYDVPVKLFSTHLLLISLFLILPDVVALWRVFFLGQAAALKGVSLPHWKRPALHWTALGLRVFLFAGLLYRSGVASYRQRRDLPVGRPPLYGVWVLDRAEGAALQEGWARVVFEHPGEMLVLQGDGERKWYDINFDERAQRINLLNPDQGSTLQWTTSLDGKLALTGNWRGSPINVSLHKIDPETFALQTRGFHWVQEYPYNR